MRGRNSRLREADFTDGVRARPLRTHQADLLATLLPQLALDLTHADRAAGHAFFAPAVSELLARNRIRWRRTSHRGGAPSIPTQGFIGCEPFLNGMAKILLAPCGRRRSSPNVRLHRRRRHATSLPPCHPACLSPASICFIPIRGRNGASANAGSCRTTTLRRTGPRACGPVPRLRFATDIDDNAGWTLARILRAPRFHVAPRHAAADVAIGRGQVGPARGMRQRPSRLADAPST